MYKDIVTIILMTFVLSIVGYAQNPIIQTIYTADPAPMVYNDTVYLYTGHDEDASTWFTMKDWRIFSSADMVNWTTHSNSLTVDAFSWADRDAWAAQCIHRNGKFYSYICAHHKTLNRMAIGVAVSDKPTGPFVDVLGEPLVVAHWGDIDPSVFIDDDGQAYLYWGNPDLWYVKLNEDMISYDQQVGVVQVPLTEEGFHVRYNNPKRSTAFEEAAWLYKRNNLYYLLFAAGGVPEHQAYSTSTSPTGPWVYQDTIMHVIKDGGAFTNHPGLIDFKGNSYFFYHNGALPGGGGFNRSVCVEQFEFNADGSIPLIEPTSEGVVNSVSYLNPFKRVEAETIGWGEGVETVSNTDGGILVTDIDNGDYIKVRSVDFRKGAKRFEAGIANSTGNGAIEIRIDDIKGTLVGTCTITDVSDKQNIAVQTCKINKVKGVHDVYFVFKGSEGDLFNFEWWKLSKK